MNKEGFAEQAGRLWDGFGRQSSNFMCGMSRDCKSLVASTSTSHGSLLLFDDDKLKCRFTPDIINAFQEGLAGLWNHLTLWLRLETVGYRSCWWLTVPSHKRLLADSFVQHTDSVWLKVWLTCYTHLFGTCAITINMSDSSSSRFCGFFIRGETNRSNIRIKVFVHRRSNFVSLFELFVPLAHVQNNPAEIEKKPVLAMDKSSPSSSSVRKHFEKNKGENTATCKLC